MSCIESSQKPTSASLQYSMRRSEQVLKPAARSTAAAVTSAPKTSLFNCMARAIEPPAARERPASLREHESSQFHVRVVAPAPREFKVQRAATDSAVCHRCGRTMAEDQHARRDRQNAIALVVLALLLAGGAVLLHYLMQRSALLDCLSSGRRNCEQLEPSSVP